MSQLTLYLWWLYFVTSTFKLILFIINTLFLDLEESVSVHFPGIFVGVSTCFVRVTWKPTETCSILGFIIDEHVTRVYFKIAAVFLFLTAVILILIYGTIFYKVKKIHKTNFLVSVEYINCKTHKNIDSSLWETSRWILNKKSKKHT